MTFAQAELRHWYQEKHGGKLFEIVALDTEEHSIQVQYLDGELADLDRESWNECEPQRAAAPEDWRTAFELDEQAMSDPDDPIRPIAWGDPLDRVEPDNVLAGDDE